MGCCQSLKAKECKGVRWFNLQFRRLSGINEANRDKEWTMGGSWDEGNCQSGFPEKTTENNFKFCNVKNTRIQT